MYLGAKGARYKRGRQDSRHQSKKVRSLALGEKPVELVTGLVTRSTDPKSYMITAFYDALAKGRS